MGTAKKQETGVVVNSWADCDYQIAEIRDKEVQIISLQRSYDDAVLDLQKQYIEPKNQLKDEINYITGMMQSFCEANRSDMDGGKKKVLSNGEVYYRALPMSLKTKEGESDKSIIDKIVKLGKKFADKYIRHKREVDANSIKKDYEQSVIDLKFLSKLGLSIEKSEKFYVKCNP